MTALTPKQLHRICHHEAGHAVLGMRSPWHPRITGVCIGYEEGAEQSIVYYDPPHLPKVLLPRHHLVIESLIVASWAGQIAEKIATGSVNKCGSSADEEFIEEMAAHLFRDDSGPAAYTSELFNTAEKKVSLYWQDIERVAHALKAYKTLTRRELKRLLA